MSEFTPSKQGAAVQEMAHAFYDDFCFFVSKHPPHEVVEPIESSGLGLSVDVDSDGCVVQTHRFHEIRNGKPVAQLHTYQRKDLIGLYFQNLDEAVYCAAHLADDGLNDLHKSSLREIQCLLIKWLITRCAAKPS